MPPGINYNNLKFENFAPYNKLLLAAANATAVHLKNLVDKNNN